MRSVARSSFLQSALSFAWVRSKVISTRVTVDLKDPFELCQMRRGPLGTTIRTVEINCAGGSGPFQGRSSRGIDPEPVGLGAAGIKHRHQHGKAIDVLAPVTKRLQRDARHLAILSLIQVGTLPRLMVRQPEALAVTPQGSVLIRHLALRFCKLRTSQIAIPALRHKRARTGRLPIGSRNSRNRWGGRPHGIRRAKVAVSSRNKGGVHGEG